MSLSDMAVAIAVERSCWAPPRGHRSVRSEVEEVEEVPDGGHVARRVGVGGVVWVLHGVQKVVATALAEFFPQHPVALDELHDRGVLVVDVADVPAGREG